MMCVPSLCPNLCDLAGPWDDNACSSNVGTVLGVYTLPPLIFASASTRVGEVPQCCGLRGAPHVRPQGFEYGDDGGEEEQPMVDAQEIVDEEGEGQEEYEDPQREFATPAGSQSGESPDLLGKSEASILLLGAVSELRITAIQLE